MNTCAISRIILIICVLTGCATPKPAEVTAEAWLKPGIRVHLPSPERAEPVAQQQLLTATVNGKQQSLLVLLNADRTILTLVGLSPLGIRLFKVDYDQRGIHTQQSVELKGLPPANQVLSDIMLTYWPIEAWQPLLPEKWQLVDRANQRSLYDNHGNPIVRIDYLMSGDRRQPVSITHYAFHYQISIQNVGE